MSDITTHLLLPYILASQAQKHVTHNEALTLLDAATQLAVLDRTRTTPPGAPVKHLSLDQKWTEAPELGMLADVFEQDMENLPYVQQGLHASKTGAVNLANYQEIRIRQFQDTLARYVGEEP